MQTRILGQNGPVVSAIGLGCMGMSDFYGPADTGESIATIHAALDAGVTLLDTGDFYGMGHNEMLLRDALAHRRDRAFVAVKFGALRDPAGAFIGYDGRPAAVKTFLAYTLRRLGTDYVDLYQIHRWDPHTPIEETLEALHDVVKAGKARYLGASSMYAWQFSKALYLADRYGWTRFVAMQDHYNLLNREEEREMHGLCLDQGIAVLPWSPLARGRLTRDWDANTARSDTDEFGKTLYTTTGDRDIVERVRVIAEERGIPRAQVALAWLLHKPVVCAPIVGARTAKHLDDAVAALGVTLSSEEICRLEEPYGPHPVVGFA